MIMNIIFILGITIVGMIFGALYFSPVMMYKVWAKELGFDSNAEIDQKEGNKAMAMTSLSLLISVAVLAYIKVAFNFSVSDFIILGLVLGLVPTYRHILNTKTFEGKSTRLILINALYCTIELLIMVIGVALLIK